MPRALVIVDIQRDYFPGGKMPLHEPEAAAEKASQVLETFRAAGDPVIHVQHLSPAGGGFLEEGTDGADIMLPRQEGETLITKRAPNSFLGTDLEQTLRDLECHGLNGLAFEFTELAHHRVEEMPAGLATRKTGAEVVMESLEFIQESCDIAGGELKPWEGEPLVWRATFR